MENSNSTPLGGACCPWGVSSGPRVLSTVHMQGARKGTAPRGSLQALALPAVSPIPDPALALTQFLCRHPCLHPTAA